MRRSAAPAAAVALAAVLAALPARLPAAVEGSPHDLIAQGYDVVKTTAGQDRCDRCHLGGADATGFLPAVPPVLEGSWGRKSLDCFSCHDGTTIVSPDVDASLTAFNPAGHGTNLAQYEGFRAEDTGLPDLDRGRLECTTCHDPHENGHRPFLRSRPQELCLACHSRWAEIGRGKENRTGNHLVGVDPAAAPREGVPLTIGPAFATPLPSPYPLQRGKGAADVHWDLGGRLAGGREGAVTCATCHLVHGDEERGPRPHLLPIEPVNDVANLFCEGCHAGRRGDGERSAAAPNPGGTTAARTYHPCDDDVSNGPGRDIEVTIPAGWPLGGGSPPRLLCTTCHAPHGAAPETALLRVRSQAETFCGECHAGTPAPHHHPVGVKGRCASRLPPGPDGTAGMWCERCHRAHNAGLGADDEKRFVPLLREETSAAACTACHPADNPTCNDLPDFRASHFMGDPMEAYGDSDPPLRRDPWPETGLASLYEGPANRSITCLTCHAFAPSAVISAEPGKGRFLVARSGNAVEWAAGGETTYLCAGCHSVDPGTGEKKGHSHPMMEAAVANLGRTILPPVSSTPGGKLNCDSCHRPHEALTRGGYYILEAVDGSNTDAEAVHPKIDFTVLCHRCHDEKKY